MKPILGHESFHMMDDEKLTYNQIQELCKIVTIEQLTIIKEKSGCFLIGDILSDEFFEKLIQGDFLWMAKHKKDIETLAAMSSMTEYV